MTNSKIKCIHSTSEGERTGTGATSCGAPSGRWLSSSMQMLSWSNRHLGPGILTCSIVCGKAIHHYRTAQRDFMRKHHGKDQPPSMFSNTSFGNADAALVDFQDDGKRLTSVQLRQKYKEARKKSETGEHKVLISWVVARSDSPHPLSNLLYLPWVVRYAAPTHFHLHICALSHTSL